MPGPAGGQGSARGSWKPSRGFSAAGPDPRLPDEPGSLVWRTGGHPRLARPGPRPLSPTGTPPENSLPRSPQMCHVPPAPWALRCCASSRNALPSFSRFKGHVCRKLLQSAGGRRWHERHHPLQNGGLRAVDCQGCLQRGKEPSSVPQGLCPSRRRVKDTGGRRATGAFETLSSTFS